MGTLVDFSGSARRSRPTWLAFPGALPLVACNADRVAEWRLERLSEDRFRLTVTADVHTAANVMVFIEGGLLHVENMTGSTTDGVLDCRFLLLEPLSIVRVDRREDMLVIELERDHATPCRAVVPPVLHEGVAAFALAA